MTWHDRWTPFPGGNFIELFQTIFCNVILCLPQTFFQSSQFFSNWELSEIYISLWCLYSFETIEVYISVHIDLFYIFLCWNVWNRSRVKWYGIAHEPPYQTKCLTDILVWWTPPNDLIWNQSDISITCLNTSSFYKVFHNDKNAQCGINHMYTVVSQKCNIYQLHSYST